MKRYRISTGTVTYAIKGRDLLRKNGFNAYMERIYSGPGSAGCGYTVVVSGDLSQAVRLLRAAGVKVLETNEL
ncbi:MAG: DUF3343 domain-containing protein [Clostridia bacterium]|nr:DUF3343 domain-containing protein [Clostridia bacterium]